MAVNTDGVFYGMRAQIKAMLKNGSGSIVNTGSYAGVVGLKNLAPYCASKHAVLGMSKAAAVELGMVLLDVVIACP